MSHEHDAELRIYLSRPQIDLSGIPAMIKKGANPNTVNDSGDNLLHLLIYSRAYKLIPWAVTLGVDVNRLNHLGHSPLQYLLNQQPVKFEAAAVLIQAGANVDTTNSTGDTLCHLAAEAGDLKALCAAIKLGADVQKTNFSNNTPLFQHLNQPSINPETTALLVFAISGALKITGRLLLPRIEHDNILDTKTWRVEKKFRIARESLDHLGKTSGLDHLDKPSSNKKLVYEYIKSLPVGMQMELLDQALSPQTPLNKFFSAQRSLFQTVPSRGYLLKLKTLRDELNPVPTLTMSTQPSAPPAYNPQYAASAPPVPVAGSGNFYAFSSTNGYPGMFPGESQLASEKPRAPAQQFSPYN